MPDMVPKKKLQVFVSSTYDDLKEERQAAVKAILSSGHIPAGMELFAAGDKAQMRVIKKWIKESDAFLLILGGRYGSIESESGKSYIELEYEYARKQRKPVFAVVIDQAHLEQNVKLHASKILETKHSQQLKGFSETVKKNMVRFFNDPKDIEIAVHETLSEFSERPKLVGWIRGDQAVSNAAVEEFAQIAAESALLKEQLKAAEDTSKRLSFQQLERRVGEVISNERLNEFIPNFPFGALAGEPRLAQAALRMLTDDEFLAHVSNVLGRFNIPLSERFRRQALFRNLDELCSSSKPEQAQLFYGELQSQIHDASARMLTIKALAEQDKGTLHIFGRFGITFNVLNDAQDLADELTRRFSPNR